MYTPLPRTLVLEECDQGEVVLGLVVRWLYKLDELDLPSSYTLSYSDWLLRLVRRVSGYGMHSDSSICQTPRSLGTSSMNTSLLSFIVFLGVCILGVPLSRFERWVACVVALWRVGAMGDGRVSRA